VVKTAKIKYEFLETKKKHQKLLVVCAGVVLVFVELDVVDVEVTGVPKQCFKLNPEVIMTF
jgi:hypothetical protein